MEVQTRSCLSRRRGNDLVKSAREDMIKNSVSFASALFSNFEDDASGGGALLSDLLEAV